MNVKERERIIFISVSLSFLPVFMELSPSCEGKYAPGFIVLIFLFRYCSLYSSHVCLLSYCVMCLILSLSAVLFLSSCRVCGYLQSLALLSSHNAIFIIILSPYKYSHINYRFIIFPFISKFVLTSFTFKNYHLAHSTLPDHSTDIPTFHSFPRLFLPSS